MPADLTTTEPAKIPLTCAALVAVHVLALVWIAAANSPVSDETAHLVAGLNLWRNGRFDIYTVNPPLVRTIASIPAYLAGAEVDWDLHRRLTEVTFARPEWSLGIDFVRKNVHRCEWDFFYARICCLPFSMLGAFVCYRWSARLCGTRAGLLAVSLWCLSPTVLTWSATICPDAAAAALGIAAAYAFWRWLSCPCFINACGAGLLLGFAQLSKMTWLVLYLLWPLLWLICHAARRARSGDSVQRRKELTQLILVLLISLTVLNMGYGFDGTFTSLGNFRFRSEALTGSADGNIGNRFRQTVLTGIPVPLPRDFVLGADLQKRDFERGLPSYLFGNSQSQGWWYYYIACYVLKTPIGEIALTGIAIAIAMRARLYRRAAVTDSSDSPLPYDCYRSAVLVLLAHAATILVFVSSQFGFSQHFRYVLPAFPFIYIFVAVVLSQALASASHACQWTVKACLGWTLLSTAFSLPSPMSYFNEFGNTDSQGRPRILGSSLDWGQDAYRLRRWLQSHPEIPQLHAALRNSFSFELVRNSPDTIDRVQYFSPTSTKETGLVVPLRQGWYAISANELFSNGDLFALFGQLKPEAMVGRTIAIYRVDGSR